MIDRRRIPKLENKVFISGPNSLIVFLVNRYIQRQQIRPYGVVDLSVLGTGTTVRDCLQGKAVARI